MHPSPGDPFHHPGPNPMLCTASSQWHTLPLLATPQHCLAWAFMPLPQPLSPSSFAVGLVPSARSVCHIGPLSFHATSLAFSHFSFRPLQLSCHHLALWSQPLHATSATHPALFVHHLHHLQHQHPWTPAQPSHCLPVFAPLVALGSPALCATRYDSFMPFVPLTQPCFATLLAFVPFWLSATPAFMPPCSAFVPLSFHATIRFFVTNMLHQNESNHTQFSYHSSCHCPVPPLTTSCHSRVPATPVSQPVPSPSHSRVPTTSKSPPPRLSATCRLRSPCTPVT